MMSDFETQNGPDISNDQQSNSAQQPNNDSQQNQQQNAQPNWQQSQSYGTVGYKQKSKIAAGLFGIFLGSLGVHNFYLGYTGKAVAQLLITLLTCGIGSVISGIWGLIEGILILTGEISVDAQGVMLRD